MFKRSNSVGARNSDAPSACIAPVERKKKKKTNKKERKRKEKKEKERLKKQKTVKRSRNYIAFSRTMGEKKRGKK